MASEISKQAPNKTNDNLSQIDSDIDSLYKKYLSGIDAIRSKSRPQLSVANYKDETSKGLASQKITSLITPYESRAHAFYRMVGMPVVSPNNGYYSPGFSPSSPTNKNKIKINTSYYENTELVNFIYQREKFFSDFQLLFSTSIDELETLVYSLLSRYSFPFAVTNPDSSDHLKKDEQKIEVDSRELSLFTLNNIDKESEISQYIAKYKSVFHPIKPFIVDPRIALTVDPQENIICVPFLKNKDETEIEKGVFLKTPVIQDIIEQRLEDPDLNEGFLKFVENIFTDKENTTTTSIDYQTLVITVSGLLEEAKIQEDIKNFTKDKLLGVSNVQYSETLKITKTIKALVIRLIQSQRNLDWVNSIISWVPVPGASGPGVAYGWKLSENFLGIQLKIDSAIKELKLQKISAETEAVKKPTAGISASPFVRQDGSENVKNYDKSLAQLNSDVNELAKKGFQALRTIEVIKGEVSGLGLIDVLSFYYGLWSMSLENLLYLIDDEAIARMIAYNPSYEKVSAVTNRKNTSGTSAEVLKSLKELESRVYFMLDFADKYYEECLEIKSSKDAGG